MEKPIIIVQGKGYPLFKRNTLTSTPWSVRVQHNGTRRAISTGTADIPQAKERAERLVKAALSGNWMILEDSRMPGQKPKNYATIDQVLKAAQGLEVASLPAYLKSFTQLMTTATGQPMGTVKKLTADVLTAPLARSFQAKMQGLKSAQPDTMTPKNSTANRILKDSRSLFSRKAQAHYERHGLSLHDLRPWLTVPLLTVQADRYSDHPITNTILDEIDAAISNASKDVRTTHHAIRFNGTPPGNLKANPSAAHARFLKRWNLTPSDIWHHAAACMFKRTRSLSTTAQWVGMSEQQVKWHVGDMQWGKIEPLRAEESRIVD